MAGKPVDSQAAEAVHCIERVLTELDKDRNDLAATMGRRGDIAMGDAAMQEGLVQVTGISEALQQLRQVLVNR
jgi:hypothetical protein